jgi:hypothetical protein
MISTNNFTQSDLKNVQNLPKTFKLTFFLFIVFCIPLSLIVGLVGLLRKGYGYWITSIVCLIFLGIICIFIFLKNYIEYKKDISNQIKLIGEVNVISKSTRKNETIINFNSSELKKIDVYSKKIFDKIHVGDTLTIEVSKFSKYLLKLEKDGQSLLNGS